MLTTRYGLGYSALAAPLALIGLPLYVFLPNLFSQSTGLSLAMIGSILLAARVFEAAADPLIGRGIAKLHVNYAAAPHRWLMCVWLAVVVTAVAVLAVLQTSFWLSMMPSPVAKAAALTVCVGLAYLGYSTLTIAHHTLGAAHIAQGLPAAKLYTLREGCALAGVLAGSVLPLVISWQSYGWVTALLLVMGMVLLRPHWAVLAQNTVSTLDRSFRTWQDKTLRATLLAFFVSSLSSGLPATLLAFFVADVLGLPQQAPVFLAIYFVAAALGFGLWSKLASRHRLETIWSVAMLGNVVAFVGAAMLNANTPMVAWWFGAVCAATGFLLGAELLLPQTIIANRLATTQLSQHAGIVFGWWTAAQKTALALAAGVGLWGLAAVGYSPGDNTNTTGLVALYCWIPCALKLLAAFLVRRIHAATSTT